MLQRVSDYIAHALLENGISQVFTVVGGGAMYLNDSFGHCLSLDVTYNHHEQACAIAAEGYARVNNQMAAVCVTTGPGATNAITGVAGAWMDSIPMLIISGQARYATTVYASGLKLRTRGIQEFDIIGSVSNMTKYCELVNDPSRVKYCLEKAIYLAKEGRPGPCWLDIPLDVQGAIIDPDSLHGYQPMEIKSYDVPAETVNAIVCALMKASKPLIFAGNGIRLSGAHEKFVELVEYSGIPVISGMGSVDALESDHPCYVGREGTTGTRAGNFAVQNCDFLLSIGSRQSFLQTGFDVNNWAPKAFKVINDIDCEELKRKDLNPDIVVWGDACSLINQLYNLLVMKAMPDWSSWKKRCAFWKSQYPVVTEKHYQNKSISIYAFYKEMTKQLSANEDIVVGVGTSRVAGSQAAIIKKGQRFYANPTMAAMGYDLPAAIGVCIAKKKARIALVTGEGSIQMNIQELQTIVHNKLPIAIYIMNNQGYHSIRMTQNNFFNPPLVGVGDESGDLSFPNLCNLAYAYGIPYYRVDNTSELIAEMKKIQEVHAPFICEVILSVDQTTEPKVSSQRLEDGTMISASLENMAPFLSQEELSRNMKG